MDVTDRKNRSRKLFRLMSEGTLARAKRLSHQDIRVGTRHWRDRLVRRDYRIFEYDPRPETNPRHGLPAYTSQDKEMTQQ